MSGTYDRVVISDTLFPDFFKEAALNNYAIQVNKVPKTTLEEAAKNATYLGMFAIGTFLRQFMNALTDQKEYVTLYKNEVTLTLDTLFIVISSDPIAPYTAYTCTPTPESVGTEKQLLNYIDVYCTKH
jgi:hypothetical protein